MRLIVAFSLLGWVVLSRAQDCELKFKIAKSEIDNKLCTVKAADKTAMDAVKKTVDDAKKDMDKMEKDQKTFSAKMQGDILTEQVERVKVKGQVLTLKQKLDEAQKKNDELKKLVEEREKDLKSMQADIAKATDEYNKAKTLLTGKTTRSSEIHLALDPAEYDPFSTDDPDFFQGPVEEEEGEEEDEVEEDGETEEKSDSEEETEEESKEDTEEVLPALERFLEEHDI